jgi:Ca2+-binding RTX toxin-like protein
MLDGGDGNDLLEGGSGADLMIGGTGADTFRYVNLNDSFIFNGQFQDVILDFEHGVDKLDFQEAGIQLADLLTQNYTDAGHNYCHVGVDANHNGTFDENEFAIVVAMKGNAFLTLGDLA